MAMSRLSQGLLALIDVLIATEDGKMGEPLPDGLPQIIAATNRLLGSASLRT